MLMSAKSNLIYRRDDDGKHVLLMAAYFDDEILAGKRYSIEDVKRGLREHVTISDLGSLRRHLAVHCTKGENDERRYYETEMKVFVMDTVAIYEKLIIKKQRRCFQVRDIHPPSCRRTTEGL
jgi:hypothetical protein